VATWPGFVGNSAIPSSAARPSGRSRLGHPVVDADGHLVEFRPMVVGRLRETLSLKAVVVPGVVPRPVRPDGTPDPWVDTLGHGSLHDYTPFWRRWPSWGVAPADAVRPLIPAVDDGPQR
jgi:hypothetical protein